MHNSNDLSTSRPLLAVVLLVVAIVAVFGQIHSHEFLTWDDEQHVVNNPLLNPVTWHGVELFWQGPYWGLYIPLSYTFFAGETFLSGQPLKSAVFHLGNLTLHVVCVLLVFVILRRLFRHDGAACAGALLFGLHPVQVESVAWISETRGVLCGMFSLLAVWQYLCYAHTSGSRKSAAIHYVLATVAFILALLAKPAAVATPLIVGVLELGLLRRSERGMLWRWLGLSLWLIVAAGWAMWTKRFQPDALLPFVPSLWARPLLAGDALAFYLYKLVAPLRCGPDYGRTPAWVMQQWWFYVTWLLPAVLLIALACLRNRRLWLTAGAVFLVWLLPVLGLVPFSFQRISTVSDRYLYLALLGPALALSWFLARRWNRWTVGITAPILCVLGALSFIQTSYWRDNDALLTHALRVNPRSVVAKQHRGFLLARKGEYEDAIDWYRNALEDHPQHQELYFNLAISLVAEHRVDEALDTLREALKQDPQWPLVRCKLADVLAQQGAIGEAMDQYRAALQYHPDCAAAHRALGKLLFDRGAIDKAVDHYQAALKLDPNHSRAHVNLGIALSQQGKTHEAIGHYRDALQIDPNLVEAYVNLGLALETERCAEEAEAVFRRGLRLAPPDSELARQIQEILRAYENR